MTKLVISIQPKNEDELIDLIQTASRVGDLVEIRLDAFSELPYLTLQSLLRQFDSSIILTPGSLLSPKTLAQEAIKLFTYLGNLGSGLLDFPSFLGSDVFSQVTQSISKDRFIVSYHDYESTPDDLEAIFHSLIRFDAHLIKIATMTHSSLDAFRLLDFMHSANKRFPTAIMGMGYFGKMTRILASKFGSKLCYCCLSGKSTAPGQLDVDELKNTYHWHQINKNSKILALIGDPIEQSLSHITHNAVLRSFRKDAVYVKIPIRENEASQAFDWIDKLGFQALSITMPLKDMFIRNQLNTHTNSQFQRDSAFNTAWKEGSQWLLCNTDGIAAVEALEEIMPVRNKRFMLLGAGSTAEAIVRVLVEKRAHVDIFNRSPYKAYSLAKSLNCQGFDLQQINRSKSLDYDGVLNVTSSAMNMVCDLPKFELEGCKVALEVVAFPKNTTFIDRMKQNGCSIIVGMEMWIRQAAKQFACWFRGEITEEEASVALRHALNALSKESIHEHS